MKASNTALILATLTLTVTLLSGCATVPQRSVATEPSIQKTLNAADVLHVVKARDRLGNIAIQYTGAFENWQAIAQHNGIPNPRFLSIGTVIAIPNSLLIQQASETQKNTDSTKKLHLVAASRPDTTTATSNTLAVKRSTSQQPSDVVLNTVNPNRSFKLSPIKLTTAVGQPQYNSPAAKVQVVGTYFPKGIYRQPASYSTLVMRAAPGTLFELEYLANDWYKIITLNGTGYLREDDGKIVSANAQP